MKANRGKSISEVSRLNIWHINQLLNSEREYMITWRQLKVLRGKRYVGKKARWFSVFENEVIENMHTRRIKEEFKGEKGFLIEQKGHKITIDKRRKEWIMFETDYEQGLEIGHIIKKSRRTAEVEAWEEDKENSKHQREEYIEESKLKKKENGKRRVVLKEAQDISNLIRKKESIPYIVVNKEVLFRAEKRKKNITKHAEVKKLRGLERVCIENNWGAELIDQLIKEENI